MSYASARPSDLPPPYDVTHGQQSLPEDDTKALPLNYEDNPVQPSFNQQPVVYPQPSLPQSNSFYGYNQGPFGAQTQQEILIATHGVITREQVRPLRSFCSHIVLSCAVFWCCGWICGLIAFILALFASSYENQGKTAGATKLGHASYVLSIIGIITGVIILSVYLSMYMNNKSTTQISGNGIYSDGTGLHSYGTGKYANGG